MPTAYTRHDCGFESRGSRCAAWFYETVVAPQAVVVMAHGFGAHRTFALPAVAQRFAKSGYGVLLFDHRHLGDSEGRPRGLVDPFRQLDDWRAAISFARSKADRVVLWGTSFSGGHVISIAAEDHDVGAVVAQAPFVDPISTARLIGPSTIVRLMLAAGADACAGLLGLPPLEVAVHGPPGATACLATRDSDTGFRGIVSDSTWRNRCPARSALAFARYRPLWKARDVRCPALVVLAEEDTLIAPAVVERTARKMPRGELLRIDAGHFDVYHGRLRDDLLDAQVEFLDRHLGTPAVPVRRAA